jgi:hypothetical protein
MSEQEKENRRPMSDDPDVEAHKAYGDEGSDREGAERRETDDGSDDVEAHLRKA